MHTSALKNFTPSHPQRRYRHLHTHTHKHMCTTTTTHTHMCMTTHNTYTHTHKHMYATTPTHAPPPAPHPHIHTVNIPIPLPTGLHSAGCRFPNLVYHSLALIPPQLTRLCQFAPRGAHTPQCFGGSHNSRRGCKVKHQNSAVSEPTNKIVSWCNLRALTILNSILFLTTGVQNQTNLSTWHKMPVN